MIQPITPKEVVENYKLPDVVLESVNEIVQETWDGKRARFLQKDLIAKILEKDKELTREILFDRCYLDIEETYRKQDWKVEYYKPDYTEDFESYFVFKVKK